MDPSSAAAGNEELYRDEQMGRTYSADARWENRGEELAVRSVVSAVRGRPVLDLGIGAGRTTSLLRLLTDDYTGIDYSPFMVDAARAAAGDLDIRLGDARDLSAFGGRGFALVLFSYNGIDSVSHEDRGQVLGQVRSVLAEDGYFVYSTLNKAGPWFDQPPWRRDGTADPGGPSIVRAARFGAKVLLNSRYYVRWWTAWLRLRGRVDDHGGWAFGPLGGLGAGLVVHWTTVAESKRELLEAGLTPVAVFDGWGTRLADGQEATTGDFHIVARRA